MAQITLKVRNLKKVYGKEVIIKNISFELHDGEIVGLIGENGSGKTTTLSMIAGIKSITDGEIFVCDVSVGQKEEYYKNIAIAFDERPFYPYMSGEANLFQVCRSGKEIARMLRMCGLMEDRNKKVSSYSLGMRQKLNIARALLKKSKVLLMDEPFNGLDPKALITFKENVKREIEEQKATLLISSHALKELMYFCNRYLFIKDGEIFADVQSEKGEIEQATAYLDLVHEPEESIEELINKLGANVTYIKSLQRIYLPEQMCPSDEYRKKLTPLPHGQTVLENIYMAMSTE